MGADGDKTSMPIRRCASWTLYDASMTPAPLLDLLARKALVVASGGCMRTEALMACSSSLFFDERSYKAATLCGIEMWRRYMRSPETTKALACRGG
jgi:hypothetical protein